MSFTVETIFIGITIAANIIIPAADSSFFNAVDAASINPDPAPIIDCSIIGSTGGGLHRIYWASSNLADIAIIPYVAYTPEAAEDAATDPDDVASCIVVFMAPILTADDDSDDTAKNNIDAGNINPIAASMYIANAPYNARNMLDTDTTDDPIIYIIAAPWHIRIITSADTADIILIHTMLSIYIYNVIIINNM